MKHTQLTSNIQGQIELFCFVPNYVELGNKNILASKVGRITIKVGKEELVLTQNQFRTFLNAGIRMAKGELETTILELGESPSPSFYLSTVAEQNSGRNGTRNIQRGTVGKHGISFAGMRRNMQDHENRNESQRIFDLPRHIMVGSWYHERSLRNTTQSFQDGSSQRGSQRQMGVNPPFLFLSLCKRAMQGVI